MGLCRSEAGARPASPSRSRSGSAVASSTISAQPAPRICRRAGHDDAPLVLVARGEPRGGSVRIAWPPARPQSSTDAAAARGGLATMQGVAAGDDAPRCIPYVSRWTLARRPSRRGVEIVVRRPRSGLQPCGRPSGSSAPSHRRSAVKRRRGPPPHRPLPSRHPHQGRLQRQMMEWFTRRAGLGLAPVDHRPRQRPHLPTEARRSSGPTAAPPRPVGQLAQPGSVLRITG